MLNKLKKFQKDKLKFPQNSRARLVFIIVLVLVAVLIVAGVFHHRKADVDNMDNTKINSTPDNIDSTPGSDHMSKEYMQTLLKSDKMKATNALKQGQSALPTLVNTGSGGAQSNDFQTSRSSNKSVLDKLVDNGDITKRTAGELKALQKQDASLKQYEDKLQDLLQSGKIDVAQAKALLSDYKKQREGEHSISPDTQETLDALNSANLTPEQYRQALQRLVSSGKLSPAQAHKLLQQYRQQHGTSKNTEKSGSDILSKMASSGDIDPQTAKELASLDQQGVPASDYAAKLGELVREGKLTPAQAQKLLQAYRKKHGDFSLSKQAKGNQQLASLEKMQQQQQLQAQQQALAAMKQSEAQQQEMESKQALQSMQNAMSTQAKTMFTSWNAPTPANTVVLSTKEEQTGNTNASGKSGSTSGKASSQAETMIKAGDIMFAVLNTAVNSDHPGPVMATIVSGKYKGAKLLGGLTLQTDRVKLQFNTISMENWSSTVSINAVAIDPDTARTALASDVNHHYLSRYGSLFAASFLEGYANALSSTGTTIVNGSTGTVTTTRGDYSPQGRMMIGFGNVGKQLSTQVAKNFNRPATVKVDSGVGVGVLFMKDVKQPDFLTNNAESSEK